MCFVETRRAFNFTILLNSLIFLRHQMYYPFLLFLNPHTHTHTQGILSFFNLFKDTGSFFLSCVRSDKQISTSCHIFLRSVFKNWPLILKFVYSIQVYPPKLCLHITLVWSPWWYVVKNAYNDSPHPAIFTRLLTLAASYVQISFSVHVSQILLMWVFYWCDRPSFPPIQRKQNYSYGAAMLSVTFVKCVWIY